MAEIKKPEVEVLFDKILTTYKSGKTTAGGIFIDAPDSRQTVVACGPNSSVTIGDEIEINFLMLPKRYEKAKYDKGPDKAITVLPIEEIDGEEYLYISSREVKWIYTK